MFGSFDTSKFDIPDDNTEGENKTFDLTSYADYMAEKEKGKKKEYKRPKELQGKNKDILKIVKYSTNKHKIKQRKLMEDNIIPQHASLLFSAVGLVQVNQTYWLILRSVLSSMERQTKKTLSQDILI
jgi:hypothetical protein